MTATAFKVKPSEKPSAAALREARARWGKDGHVRDNKTPSSAEGRAEYRNLMLASKERLGEIDAEITERLSKLDWYQELVAEKKQLRKVQDNAQGWACYYRFTVGKLSTFCFSVRGQGDSWAEAFEKADRA